MKDLTARLEKWLEEHHPKALKGLRRGLTDVKIARFEKSLGVALPEGMRALYRWRNGNGGSSFEAIQNGRQLMSLEDVVEARGELRELAAAGELDSPDHWHTDWVPFMDDGGGGMLVWDPKGSFAKAGGKPGQILEYWDDDPRRNIVAPSFDVWLAAFVESLEAGLWVVDEEEGNVAGKKGIDAFMQKRVPGFPIVPIQRARRRTKG